MASRTNRGLPEARARRVARPLPVGLRSGVLALLTAALLTAPLAVPAAAHVELKDSDPPAGEQVEDEPDAVRLVFSASVQSDGAEVAVTSSDETKLGDGEPDVSGDTVTQPIDPLPTGGRYTVSYRVVSGDGHPVSDTFTFRYAPPAETSSSPPERSSPIAEDASPSAAATPAGAGAGEQDSPGGWPSWWPLAALAAIAAAAGSAAVVRLRRQRT